MDDRERARCAERLRAALHLFEVGVDLKRCQLRREHPEAPDRELERLLGEWMIRRPGEPDGAALGRVTRGTGD